MEIGYNKRSGDTIKYKFNKFYVLFYALTSFVHVNVCECGDREKRESMLQKR